MSILTEESKLLWHHERVKDWLEGEPIAPITVDLALTQACNYRCEYCYAQLQKNPGGPWTVPMIAKFARDCQSMGVKAVSLVSDGESTCNTFWREAIVLLKEHGIDVAIGTNGVLFDPAPYVLDRLTYVRYNLSAIHTERYKKIHRAVDIDLKAVKRSIEDALSMREGRTPTIGVQMVFRPEYEDQVIPLAEWCKKVGVDYFQIKHCSDDECGSLGVDYSKYELCRETLHWAEMMSDENFEVQVKWRKIKAGNQRSYTRCLAPPFHLQISGSGLVAPCGMFFHPRYEQYHLGSLHKTSFREIWGSCGYWDTMHYLASTKFDARVACGCLCLQDASNILLNEILEGKVPVVRPSGPPPDHVNFI